MSATLDKVAYTDLNRLNRLKVGDQDSEANIRKVAQEFEAVFLGQMLKSMRAASDVLADKESVEHSSAVRQYRDMYDQQMALSLSQEAGGIGLADNLVRQLRQRKGTQLQGSNTLSSEVRNDAPLLNRRRLAFASRSQVVAGSQATFGADLSAQTVRKNLGLSASQQRLTQSSQTEVVSKSQNIVRLADKTQGVWNQPFRSQEQFIAALVPMAERAAEKLGVDPEFLVAQAALETGWGKSVLRTAEGQSSHNLFGIKSTGSWDGSAAQSMTTEYVQGKAVRQKEGFRVYNSFEQSFEDYALLLQNSKRYTQALKVAASGDSTGFMQELQKAGYATDPNYARKITQIARQVEQTYQNIADAGMAPITRTRG
ncbi:flagellar protein FlgJ [Azomonas agilis]|uniref:Peptidoglycan hydrolase FlgJ n=1 Tax=Azomonas agilis TaxID=116849 RepID=A0A562I2W4_9GAMM|nr:flagellar assembly peptidoglycan hydrolase FlgJ [Azomonas agilis]TWH64983.1 flagellar protein FlgJ [Azomonas agilis]